MFNRFSTQGRFHGRRRVIASGVGHSSSLSSSSSSHSSSTSTAASKLHMSSSLVHSLGLDEDQARIAHSIREKCNEALTASSLPCPSTLFSPLDKTKVQGTMNILAKFDDRVSPLMIMEEFKAIKDSAQKIKEYIDSVSPTTPFSRSWVHELFQPIQLDKELIDEYKKQMNMWTDIHGGEKDHLGTVFQIQKVTPLHDPMFSYFVASIFPFVGGLDSQALDTSSSPDTVPMVNKLHGEIVDIYLWLNKKNPNYTKEEFQQDVTSWKDQKYTLPLLVMARLDKTFDKDTIKNLPLEACHTIQRFLSQLRKCHSWKNVTDIVGETMHQLHPHFIGYLEHIGTIMLGKDLTKDKEFFEKVLEEKSQFQFGMANLLCHNLSFLETQSQLPKFLLCNSALGVSQHLQGTWGYESLEIQVSPLEKKIDIQPCHEDIRYIPLHPGKLSTQEEPRNGIVGFSPMYYSLVRMGETLLGPKISLLMRHPKDFQQFLENNNNHSKTDVNTKDCMNREGNFRFLQKLQAEDSLHIQSCMHVISKKFSSFLVCNRQMEKRSTPFTITAWRLDLPSKVVTVASLPPKHSWDLSEPHRITRRLQQEKSNYKTIHSVVCSTHKDLDALAPRDIIAKAIKYRFQEGIDDIPEKNGHIHTLLHESVACFYKHPPVLHTQIPLHDSVQWKNDYEDKRYAETQIAKGGSARFRDWCNFMEKKVMVPQKAKLDSHVIKVDQIYHTVIAMSLPDSTYKWVKVISSLPLQLEREIFLVPPLESLADAKDLLYPLTLALKNKFKNSSHLVPTRSSTHQVTKNDMHFYMDDKTHTVLMAYSSQEDPDKNLDFMMFHMAEASV